MWDDIVDLFVEYVEPVTSPSLFKMWAGIALVAGACERRVWSVSDRGVSFPNMYTMLVAGPGVGKQVIEKVHDLWSSTIEADTKAPAFHIASDSMTRASMIDELVKAAQTRLVASGPYVYHSLLIASEEFGVLMPTYDTEFLSTLNSIWNSPNRPHKETRRHGPQREVIIPLPQINLLAGFQPGLMSEMLPETAWKGGFMRRTIMVHGSKAGFRPLFSETPDLSHLRARLLESLGKVATLYGPMRWEEKAAEELRDWDTAGWQETGYQSGGPPVPTNSKLQYYTNTRTEFIIKLSTISAISRTGAYRVDSIDLHRAFEWLFAAEEKMPDVFRDMTGKSDSGVIDDLHEYITAEFSKRNKDSILKDQTVPGMVLRRWLTARVISERIEPILKACDSAGIIVRVANTVDEWIPKPRISGRGLE